jgi:hypothetical protein
LTGLGGLYSFRSVVEIEGVRDDRFGTKSWDHFKRAVKCVQARVTAYDRKLVRKKIERTQ